MTKTFFLNIIVAISIVILTAGCGSSPGPDAISTKQVTPGTPITNCTAVCHNSKINTGSPDPLVTNGSGTFGKHIPHVQVIGLSCTKCHFGYYTKPTHMNGVLDTSNPAVLIVYFDSTNPNGKWINETGPSTGSCTDLNCHGTDTLDWYGTETVNFNFCSGCHSFALGPRRIITGPEGDFGSNASIVSHHVTTTGDPGGTQCLVCHDLSTHTSGTVRVRNADTGASIAYDPSNAAGLEPFCLSCHDENGATDTFVSGGTPTSPFNDGSVLGNPPYSYATRIASSWAKSYGHGPNGNHPSGSKLTCLGTGAPGTGCHGNAGRINAHGSVNQVLAAGVFKYDLIYSDSSHPYTESDFGLCFTCHANYAGVMKEDIFGVKFGGLLDTAYGPYGPRGQNPPYDLPGGVVTHFADHNVAGDPFGLNDPVFWLTADMNLHWFHIGAPTVDFRGLTTPTTGITCVNCHDVHGSNTPYGAVYDELAYSNTVTVGNIYGEMVISAYTTTLLNDYPTYCSFNCHSIQGPSRAWFYPITE